MKSIYVSPEIMYEDFSLSTNIAGECEHDTPLPNLESSCAYQTRSGDVFMGGNENCKYTQGVTPDGAYNSICYHVPAVDSNVFNS